MGDLFFVLKTFIGTFLLVVLLQVKVGQETIEYHVMNWIHDSPMTEPIQEAARGGVVAFRELWKKLTSGIGTEFSKTLNRDNVPGSRSLGLSLERSQAYIKEKAQQAAELAEKEARARDWVPSKETPKEPEKQRGWVE